MGNPFFRFGEPFRGSGPVGLLPEDSEISFSIGLKGNPLPVRRPDRVAIRAAQRELPRRGAACKVDDPDVILSTVVC